MKITELQVDKLERFLDLFKVKTSYPSLLLGEMKPDGRTNMIKSDNLYEVIDSNYEEEYDAYFVPNPGGTKQRDIKFLTTCFVDIDAGRDSNGKYLTPSKVTRKKRTIYKKIQSFDVEPSVIVETRNGYHCYWLLEPIANTSTARNNWNCVQERICRYFESVGGDSHVLKINQILRLPYSVWRKSQLGLQPFKTNLKKFTSNPKRYSLQELVELTQGITPRRSKAGKKKRKPQGNTWSPDNHTWGQGPSQREGDHIQKDTTNINTLSETVAFLGDVNRHLYKDGMKHMALTANRLQQSLIQEFNL